MTIRDLATLAGVSHATVSRALRNDPRQSQETRERIQKLALEHGYAPHPVVSKVMANLPRIRKIPRSHLALITDWPDWKKYPFLQRIYEGIEIRSKQLGFELEEFSLIRNENYQRISKILHTRRIEGVIFMPQQSFNLKIDMNWDHFATVNIGHSLLDVEMTNVRSSPYYNMHLAMKKLRALGYKRIGLAIEDNLRWRIDDTYLALYSLYDRYKAPKQRIPIFYSSGIGNDRSLEEIPVEQFNSVDSKINAESITDWIEKYKVDALLCNYAPLPDQLRAQGIRIPDDLGYAALDITCADPDVSGIDQRAEQWGLAAVDSVTARLNRNDLGLPSDTRMISIRGRWRDGKTVRQLS